MEFFESPVFSRYWADYFSDEAYAALQNALAANPACGDLIPGTGGFRKLRWPDPRRGKGKRGGLRLIYFWFSADDQIWLLAVYGKDEASDLTAAEKRALKGAIHEEETRRKQAKASRKKRTR